MRIDDADTLLCTSPLRTPRANQLDSFETERKIWDDSERSFNSRIAKLQQEKEELHAASQAVQSAFTSPSVSTAVGSTGTTSKSIPGSTALAVGQSTSSSGSSVLPPLPASSPTFSIPAETLEEISALHVRINELTASQTMLLAETQRLQSEMEELQRMNNDLQEENENYEVLLSERMLSGYADSGFGTAANSSMASASGDGARNGGAGLLDALSDGSRSRPTSSLDRLDEESLDEDGEVLEGDGEDPSFEEEVLETVGSGSLNSGAVPARVPVNRTRVVKKRESMIGVGGGLDLGAELERATKEEEERKEALEKEKRRKKVQARRAANASTHLGGREGDPIPDDLEALRKEVKLLRQENKGVRIYSAERSACVTWLSIARVVCSACNLSRQDPRPRYQSRRVREGSRCRQGLQSLSTDGSYLLLARARPCCKQC